MSSRIRTTLGASGALNVGTPGDVYEYIGATRGAVDDPVGLRNENYLDTTQWRLVPDTSKDIIVDAQNTSTITSLVGAIAAAGAGGLVAVAGAVGISLSDNTIGSLTVKGFDTDSGVFKDTVFQNSAEAYVTDSTVLSAELPPAMGTSGPNTS